MTSFVKDTPKEIRTFGMLFQGMKFALILIRLKNLGENLIKNFLFTSMLSPFGYLFPEK